MTADGAGASARLRQALRIAALAAASVLAALLLREMVPARETAVGLTPHPPPTPALGHIEAGARQQGQPTTADEARATIARSLAAVDRAASRNWVDRAELGNLLLARARLSNRFDDYVAAGRAFDAAFAVAAPGTGPHLDRAGWNLAVHRLAAMAPDVAAVERYAVPNDAELAAALGLRGDGAFYAGRYREARVFYERSAARMPGVGADLRLANYYARMGAPTLALAFLDQADSRVSGPQQQLRAFIEMRRGVIELDRGRWVQAEEHLRRADDIFPGYWAVEMPLARARALRGAPGDARAIFERIAARDNAPEACDGLAGLLRAGGDVAGAAHWAGKADALWAQRFALLPEAAMGHMVDHLLAFGDPARALDLARRNHELRPYGDSATALAAALIANQDPAGALAALAPTLQSGWTAAEPHLVASEAYALLGRGDQAEAARKAARAINPHALDRNPGMTWLEP